jgi:hypothetical protein
VTNDRLGAGFRARGSHDEVTIKKIRGTQAIDDLTTCRRGVGANAGFGGGNTPDHAGSNLERVVHQPKHVYARPRPGESLEDFAEHFRTMILDVVDESPSQS